jgi:hypothetical protein
MGLLALVDYMGPDNWQLSAIHETPLKKINKITFTITRRPGYSHRAPKAQQSRSQPRFQRQEYIGRHNGSEIMLLYIIARSFGQSTYMVDD